ncbi:MAG: GlsB/YeaQ/YmgE family stress response membrane protein [Gemmatimonadaceae bacterium]
MDIVTWLIVGLIAGLLASAVVGGIGYGLLGDIVVGIAGAMLGGWLFSALGISVPVAGLPGTILVAFVGAVVLLLLIRVLRPGGRLVK